MSESALKLERKDFCCSLCSNLPREPVTLPCGHSFCLDCIERHWDGEDQPTCPQCRQTFPDRPPLSKNVMLETLMAQLNTMFASSEENYAALGEIPCDVCPGKKLKAIKSCLNCKVSYCDKHLQSHLKIPQYKNHTLVEPRDSLEEENCSVHDRQRTGSKTFGQAATSSTSSETSHSPFSSINTGPSCGLFFETNNPFRTNKPTFFGSLGTTNSCFGGSTFNPAQKTGVIVKFIPVPDSETMENDSFDKRAITKDHCISAMKECEKESVEKPRLKDFQAEVKSPSNPPVPGSCFIFGSNAVTSSASTGLFSSSTPNTSLSFRQNKATVSTSTRGFNPSTGSLCGQNQSDTNVNPFSQNTQSTTASMGQAKSSMGLRERTAPAQSGVLVATAPTNTTSGSSNSTELFGKTNTLSSAVSTQLQSLSENNTMGSISTTTSLLSNKPTVTMSTGTTSSTLGLGTHTARSGPPENKSTMGGLGTGFGTGDTGLQ